MMTSLNHTTFASRLLAWFDTDGRHDLPWQYHHQSHANIYAVWLSEVMLQQTQVATVLNYFDKFMSRFPTVQDLANANFDEVAYLWAGLGYYARAKNLHQGAKQVSDFIERTGNFPQTLDEWQAIRGVGRSTAGAIMAMGVRRRGVICDGNVKRVLTRWAGIDGDITKQATDKALWILADALTPNQDSGKYAQAMMDLGATICTRTKPKCEYCPIQSDCTAHHQGNPTAYPVKAKKADKPHRHSLVFALTFGDERLWIKRTNDGGIWDGLYSLPMLMIGDDVNIPNDTSSAKKQHKMMANAQPLSLAERQIIDVLPVIAIQAHKTIKHTLTHFHWHLSLINIELDETQYKNINHALTAVNATFVWQQDLTGLAAPKAMHKLMTKSF